MYVCIVTIFIFNREPFPSLPLFKVLRGESVFI